jgi:pimeloyl-ACP methyl ester carboxylesterase
VQVLLGEHSALHDTAAVAARLADVVPSWRVEVVPGTGHALPLEAVDLVVGRVLSFAPAAR